MWFSTILQATNTHLNKSFAAENLQSFRHGFWYNDEETNGRDVKMEKCDAKQKCVFW